LATQEILISVKLITFISLTLFVKMADLSVQYLWLYWWYQSHRVLTNCWSVVDGYQNFGGKYCLIFSILVEESLLRQKLSPLSRLGQRLSLSLHLCCLGSGVLLQLTVTLVYAVFCCGWLFTEIKMNLIMVFFDPSFNGMSNQSNKNVPLLKVGAVHAWCL
jgi:hypothetical protein